MAAHPPIDAKLKLENRSLARKLQVTTNNSEIIRGLRNLGEPATLFGENEIQRRDRLRLKMAEKGIHTLPTENKVNKASESDLQKSIWYHRGKVELLNARKDIAVVSLQRAKKRLAKEVELKKESKSDIESKVNHIKEKSNEMTLVSSYVCDQHILFHTEIDSSGKYISLSSWSGKSYIHQLDQLEVPWKTLDSSSSAKCTCTTFSPNLNPDSPESNKVAFATSYSNSVINLWSANSENPLYSIKDNCGRIRRVQFHPSGRYISFCCADNSWRLFDLDYKCEILHQEGHSDEVLFTKFHQDGSLLFSGSTDTFVHVWDLRTGQSVMLLKDHNGAVMDLDISPNGFNIATAGAENIINCYDLRRKKLSFSIPAHLNNVSCVKFEKTYGNILYSSSYDKTLKAWSFPSGVLLNQYSAHSDKITAFDVSNDLDMMVSVSFDRTYKKWTKDDL